MKKFLTVLLAALMLTSMLAVSVAAAETPAVTISTASGASNETVYLTVSLAGFAPATSMAVTVTGLPLQGSSQWILSGELKDFDVGESTGVWAISGDTPVSVNGDVAKLAVKLPEYDGTQSYDVSVTVQVRDDSGLVGTASATGKVNVHNAAQSVSLSATTLSLDLCGTKTGTLTATVLPAITTETVSWTSSDPAVVSVADGVVTALKCGTATVTATAGSRRATCVVTVSCSHVNAEKVSANPATCTATGNNAYWTCGDCGKVLAEDKTTETTVQEQTLPVIDHAGGTATCTKKPVCSMCSQEYGSTLPHDFDESVWHKDENQHWHLCKTCGAEKGGVADHTYTWVTDKYATESATGLKHEACVCGVTRNENTVIDKLPHIPYKVSGKEATCEEEGKVEHFYCPNCGSYYASKDGKLSDPISSKDIVIPAKGHSYGEEYQSDDKNHWKACDCGATTEPEAHTLELVDAKEATETAEGYTGDEICSVCKAVIRKGETIPLQETQAPTEEPPQAPTDAPEAPVEEESEGGAIWLIIPPVVIAAAAAVFFVIRKKKA